MSSVNQFLMLYPIVTTYLMIYQEFGNTISAFEKSLANEVYEPLEALKSFFCEMFIGAFETIENKRTTAEDKKREIAPYQEFFSNKLKELLTPAIADEIDLKLQSLLRRWGQNSSAWVSATPQRLLGTDSTAQ